MSMTVKKGMPVFRGLVRRAFILGPALRELGIEMHLICAECKGEVSFYEETTVDDGAAISLPGNPADGKGLKAVCECMERDIWGL